MRSARVNVSTDVEMVIVNTRTIARREPRETSSRENGVLPFSTASEIFFSEGASVLLSLSGSSLTTLFPTPPSCSAYQPLVAGQLHLFVP